jgi:UDP-N-acetylmuramate dehydrogenase
MEMEIYEALCEISGVDYVVQQEPMSKHTTFRTGGPADFLVNPAAGEVKELIACCKKYNMPYMVIGNGSNLLVGDRGIRGVVIEIGKRMSDICIEGTCVTAGAGALLSAIASHAAQEGLTGFEFASGIPGSLGGAVVMNAGAYGGEIKDVLKEAVVLTKEGEILHLTPQELDLSYRHSVIPEKEYVVLEATLSFRQGNKEDIYADMHQLKEKRVSKQPLEYPSAGSTFKRPEGYFAGKLIEDAGLRGFQVGGAQVSEKHCGFVVNKNQATSADIRSLMEQVQQRVFETFGVKLEPEVKFTGEF